MAVEPWLRGILPDLDPVAEHLLRASEQIREDLAGALADLNADELWSTPHGMTPVGFHAKHLAGSTQRLCTYLEGRQLAADELAAMAGESTPTFDLIERVDAALARYERLVRELTPDRFGEIREIGRRRLQTTMIAIAIHIAEHGQRHVGQAISGAKLVRALRGR